MKDKVPRFTAKLYGGDLNEIHYITPDIKIKALEERVYELERHIFAPHINEEQYINRDQLLKDYATIIDGGIDDILKLKRVRDKMLEEFHQIEQILGKALGYPRYKDDPKNFPNATEADGVCVAPNTAASLAMEAADRIKNLEDKLMDYINVN
jgi:hypothetical protein